MDVFQLGALFAATILSRPSGIQLGSIKSAAQALHSRNAPTLTNFTKMASGRCFSAGSG